MLNLRSISLEFQTIRRAIAFIFLLIVTVLSLLIITRNNAPLKWIVAVLGALLLFAFISITGKFSETLIAVLILNLFFNVDQVLIEFQNIGATPGIRIALIDILIFLLLFKYLRQPECKIKEHFLRIKTILGAWLLLFMIEGLSMIAAGFPISSVGLLIEMIRCIVLFILISCFSASKKILIIIITILSFGIIIEALISFAQNANSSTIQGLSVLGQGSEVIRDRWQSSGQIRPGGTFGHPNNLAHFMVIVLPLIGSSLAWRLRSWNTILAASAFGLGFIALLLTYSRMGWAAFLLALFSLYFLMIFRKRENKINTVANWLIILLIGSIFVASFGMIEKRILSKDYGAAFVRIPMMKEALNILLEKPILGVGANNYSNLISNYDFEGIFYRERTHPVHNEILLHFAELGIFGGFAFCLLWGKALHDVWKNANGKEKISRIIGIGIFSGLMAQALFLQAQWVYLEAHQLFWVMLGMSYGINNICNAHKEIA